MKAGAWMVLAALGAVGIPCLLTYCINGRKADAEDLAQIATGRDVLITTDEGNALVDAEVYVAHVMPGVVDASADDSYMQAQAVVIRTNVYEAMGDATVIAASELSYQYYTEDDYLAKWGKENYKAIRQRYEQAVLATCGKTIERAENN